MKNIDTILEEFGKVSESSELSTGAVWGYNTQIKHFIRTAFAEYKRELRVEIRKLDRDISKNKVGSVGDYHTHGYNEALESVLELVK